MGGEGEDVRIVVQGELSATLLTELVGFGVRAARPGLLLFGNTLDQAALGGTLRRLHAAGLTIVAVECQRQTPTPHFPAIPQPSPPDSSGDQVAQIEVAGTLPAAVGTLLDCIALHENPATTTLEFRILNDDDLFVVLDTLEEWGIGLRRMIKLT
ncbi:MAG: hypothetical protein Q4P15_10500 [Propionibacteriaceae bacterium]|nr:hypothetical protein [Propionibacteriaceae bacterium]